MQEKLNNNLKDLDFKPNEIKVYLSLTETGEAPASIIAKKTGMARTTVISILNKLTNDGYLSTNQYRGKIYYWAESPQTLKNIFQNKVAIAQNLENVLREIYRTQPHFPSAGIFDTKKGIKNFIEKLLSGLEKKSIIYTIDSPHQGDYQKIFSDDFGKIMIELKNRKNIQTKTLIPADSKKLISPEKLLAQQITVKEMPAQIDFVASLWLIDNLLVLFSGTPPFIVSIQQPLIVKSVKSIFDFLWQMSK
ncbi:MAG: helix-turn-helix domain-containing protein [Patescibacteria group bacterium]|jgi:sugar-specific transcriptional regulator TrmB